MYEFIRGPMMWISFILFIIGLTYQIIQIIRITGKREKNYYTTIDKKRDNSKILNFFKFGWFLRGIKNFPASLKRTVLSTQPFVVIVSIIFHLGIIVTPILVLGHNILIFESFRFKIYTLPEYVTDIMTVIFLVSAFIFLVRRIFLRKVRAVSSIYDYIVLFITIGPFLTGFLAYHQVAIYKHIMIAHMITGQLMFIAAGWSKLSHMIFFFFVRFFVGSEYSFGQGSRKWQ